MFPPRLWTYLVIFYVILVEEAWGFINLIFNSISPDSTSQSLIQTLCTTSPLVQLMVLSAARQLSLSGMTFLSVSPSVATPRICFNRAAHTNGWRLRWACPILSSALKRSLSKTSYIHRVWSNISRWKIKAFRSLL